MTISPLYFHDHTRVFCKLIQSKHTRRIRNLSDEDKKLGYISITFLLTKSPMATSLSDARKNASAEYKGVLRGWTATNRAADKQTRVRRFSYAP